MNAAARLVHQGILSRHLIFIHGLTKLKITFLVLSFAVVGSLLGIIYITQLNRGLYAEYQTQLMEQDHLLQQYQQLILEQSTLMVESKLEQEALNQLGMIYPIKRQTITIND